MQKIRAHAEKNLLKTNPDRVFFSSDLVACRIRRIPRPLDCFFTQFRHNMFTRCVLMPLPPAPVFILRPRSGHFVLVVSLAMMLETSFALPVITSADAIVAIAASEQGLAPLARRGRAPIFS